MITQRVGALLASSLLLATLTAAQPPTPSELITELRVHGNYSVPDADVLGLAGVALGDRIDLDGLDAIAERIRASGRFDAVEVRKRYTSLTRTDEVALHIGEAEGAFRPCARAHDAPCDVGGEQRDEGGGVAVFQPCERLRDQRAVAFGLAHSPPPASRRCSSTERRISAACSLSALFERRISRPC